MVCQPGERNPVSKPSRTMVIFVPCSAEEGKPWEEWILRQCPRCGQASIVGHGRRMKQAHDSERDWIRVRRGICRACHLTFTFLPFWSLPYMHYSLYCRQESCRLYREGCSAEQAGAPVRDAERLADGATVLRWVRRRIVSLLVWSGWEAMWSGRPTIAAWDFSCLGRILNFGRSSAHGPPGFGPVEDPLGFIGLP